ncbi:hypothetical protein F0562_031995 [Nyssa sinensis]|uniref:C2 NT-type domain-containing protein n=1 Tax=Nyssa sinensis TaxID=561372 RepID=A0A5J5AVX9_9ASTE|nr:hypothetical protein F0562_031995 [Nyssa sinensis]
MFKLHRHKSSDKSGERIDFKFSNIQALQVPKGWDKLSVSLISVETGKTIRKSRKASVQNGNCRWTEALSESIWISRDDASKELEHCLFKLLVSMGSSRSGILGEATFNLAGYMSSRASILVSLPLKNCNHGTIIRVEIHCLTPRAKLRNEKWKDTNSYKDDPNADYGDTDNKSDASDTFTRSVGSSSYNHLGSTCQPGDLGSRESFSASGSRHSFGSIEGSLGKESFSPQRSFNGVVNNVIGRQDSTGSQNSAPYSPYHVYDSPSSNHSSNISGIPGSARHHQNQREALGRISNAIATTPLRNTGSSKNFLEAEEVTIEELGAEARLWERNARKLMLDLEVVRKEFADQSKHLANLDMKLSASNRECDGLKQEIEHLKVFLEESMAKQKATENLKFQAKGMDNIQKELEDEIKFQKESSFNLALQLKKTQESNLELVSILQEMEETIENQKMEIENLSTLESKFDDKVAKYSYGHEDSGELNLSKEVPDEKMRKASCDSDLEGSTVEHPITDLYPQFEPEDNRNLELQLQQLWESQKTLESTILYLEKTLEEKKHEIEIERDLKAQTLLDCEAEWRCKLTAKEEEIINLEAKLSKALGALDSKTMEFENRSDLIKEIEALKEKVQELERDCKELTDENLELVFKLKESRKDISTGGPSFDCSSNEYPANESPSASESEIRKLKSQIDQLELEREEEILIEGVAADQLQIQCIELKNKCTELEIQLQDFKDKAFYLDGELHKCHAEAEEQEIEIGALKQQLECYQGEKTGSKDHCADVCTKFENSESRTAIDMQELLPALCNQLQLLFINLKKHQYTPHSAVNTECKDSIVNLDILNCTEPITPKEQVEAILDNLVQLNKLFGAKITVCEDDIRVRVINGSQAQNELEAYNLKEDALVFSSQGLKSLNEELESRVADLTKELSSKASEIGELKAGHLLKEEEIEALKHRQSDLEIQISDLQETKGKMEENMEIIQREGIISSKCLDNLRNEMIMLSSSMDSRVSANKILERKSLELESSKHELELNLSELEEENVHLSERISGLEAQLRYLTDARESSRLELQHSESHVMNLQDDIRRLENEMEAQKFDTKQKWQDMQKRWLEAQEECNYLKKANPKLQATAESLIEECSSLQKSNGELRHAKKGIAQALYSLGNGTEGITN